MSTSINKLLKDLSYFVKVIKDRIEDIEESIKAVQAEEDQLTIKKMYSWIEQDSSTMSKPKCRQLLDEWLSMYSADECVEMLDVVLSGGFVTITQTDESWGVTTHHEYWLKDFATREEAVEFCKDLDLVLREERKPYSRSIT
jgi:hypothetical protein